MNGTLTYRAIPALLLLPLLAGGCGSTSDRSRLLAGTETVEMTLQPTRTGVNGLKIRIPRGFDAEGTSEAKYDMFYIFDRRDTGTVQKAMAVIQVHPAPLQILADSAVIRYSSARVDGRRSEWREGITENEGERVHQRELRRDGLFEPRNGAPEPLLHAFVVGTDSALVELLMASVESLRLDDSSSSSR